MVGNQLELEDLKREQNLQVETEINKKAVYTGQHLKLMNLFRARPNQWIPLPEILSLGIAQYNARILELRIEGEKIENRIERVDGQTHSWFKWTSKV